MSQRELLGRMAIAATARKPPQNYANLAGDVLGVFDAYVQGLGCRGEPSVSDQFRLNAY